METCHTILLDVCQVQRTPKARSLFGFEVWRFRIQGTRVHGHWFARCGSSRMLED